MKALQFLCAKLTKNKARHIRTRQRDDPGARDHPGQQWRLCRLPHTFGLRYTYSRTYTGLLYNTVSNHCNTTCTRTTSLLSQQTTLPSAREDPSYADCLEVKREYYQNYSVLGCVTQCSQSAAHLYEQFLQVQQIGFVTLGPLRWA